MKEIQPSDLVQVSNSAFHEFIDMTFSAIMLIEIWKGALTPCGLVMPYGHTDLGQHLPK